MLVRTLSPTKDLGRVTRFYADAPDYWELAEGATPGPEKAADFFTDGPPGCDLNMSHHLGLFLGGRLSGLAELAFGFPETGDAYLGFMMLGPWARERGLGPCFLEHVEGIARENQAKHLFLAVLESNPRGRAFWLREGFAETSKSGTTSINGIKNKLFRLRKLL